MTFEQFLEKCTAFCDSVPSNRVTAADAIRPELAGMQIYETPIFGVASADDPIFREYLKPGIIGPEFRLPQQWVPGAKSVISFFAPFTEAVRASNRSADAVISDEWLHGRIEGQAMSADLTHYMCRILEEAGFAAVGPAVDAGFRMTAPYCSNWSERHAAYAAGLGTFSLSRGLITKKGVAGRFGSVITTAEFPATERAYSNPFEYCNLCGACERRCPAGAIDHTRGFLEGKNHPICDAFVKTTRRKPAGEKQVVRYGCGKCQAGVPCEAGIPRKRAVFCGSCH